MCSFKTEFLARVSFPPSSLPERKEDEDEYTGVDDGMGGMTDPGHIPRAAQIYCKELIETRPIPRMLERGGVEALFANAGADERDTVVAYCMVGWRASFTYFSARLHGYDTKFYDESWHDWGSRVDLPYFLGNSRR